MIVSADGLVLKDQVVVGKKTKLYETRIHQRDGLFAFSSLFASRSIPFPSFPSLLYSTLHYSTLLYSSILFSYQLFPSLLFFSHLVSSLVSNLSPLLIFCLDEAAAVAAADGSDTGCHTVPLSKPHPPTELLPGTA